VITNRTHRSGNIWSPCLLRVCSDVAVPSDSTRYQAAAKLLESRTKRHRLALSGSIRTLGSGLLIRGFGVQVPGGAPVLTWGYASSGLPREGRFGAMFAPRLLVSPDLVDRTVPAGLAPARSARLVCRGGHSVDPGTTPTDGITQRDNYWIAQLEDSRLRARVHARSIEGTYEVHRAADVRVPHRRHLGGVRTCVAGSTTRLARPWHAVRRPTGHQLALC
jgi:hypothetical protein